MMENKDNFDQIWEQLKQEITKARTNPRALATLSGNGWSAAVLNVATGIGTKDRAYMHVEQNGWRMLALVDKDALLQVAAQCISTYTTLNND